MPLFLNSIAAARTHFVMLAEPQILKPARELRLLVNPVRGGTRRTGGEKGGAESYCKNDRLNVHGIFLSSSEVKLMKQGK